MTKVFTIPGEPCGKGRPRAFKLPSGQIRMHTDQKTESYEAKVAGLYRANCGNRLPDPDRPAFAVHITAFFAMPKSASNKRRAAMLGSPCTKKPDFDNIGKVVCDALNGLAWVDDSQVTRCTVRKVWSESGRVEVVITDTN